jgi:hypothetical protein
MAMATKPQVYLYEAARFQNKSVIDFYVKKFRDESAKKNIPAYQSPSDKENSFADSLRTWMVCLTNNELLTETLPKTLPSEIALDASERAQLLMMIKKDHETIHQALSTQLQELKDTWQSTLATLAEGLARNFPNPLDTYLDEKTKSQIQMLGEKEFEEQLSALERTMRYNIQNQLSSRMPSAEALEKIPQLQADFDAEIQYQLQQCHNIKKSREIAISIILDPIQQLNISIVLAGNVFSYLEAVNKLCKKFLGREVIK